MEKKQINILLVDDDEGLRNMMQSLFMAKGVNLEVAANGKHAIQKLKASTNTDVIVSDIKMPGMDGISLIEKLKEEIPEFNIPIILMSGNPVADHIREAKRLGVAAILVKPFKMQDLFAKIIECTEHKRGKIGPN